MAATFCALLTTTTASAATYFSQGSLAPNLTASWNTLPGGGAQPPNFTSGDTFTIQNGHNMTTSAAWSVSGSGSQLIITGGGTLTATSAATLSAGTFFQILAGGTYGTGSVNCSGGLTTVNGNLTVTNIAGFEFRLSGTTTYTLTVGGNLTISGGTLNLSNASSPPSGGGPFTVNIGGNFTQSGSGGFLSSNTTVFPTVVFTGGASSATFSGTGSSYNAVPR